MADFQWAYKKLKTNFHSKDTFESEISKYRLHHRQHKKCFKLIKGSISLPHIEWASILPYWHIETRLTLRVRYCRTMWFHNLGLPIRLNKLRYLDCRYNFPLELFSSRRENMDLLILHRIQSDLERIDQILLCDFREYSYCYIWEQMVIPKASL